MSKRKPAPPNAQHHPECVAQQANPLFTDEAGPCICPRGWPKKPCAARVPNPCFGAELVPVEVPTEHFQVSFPFTPSVKQLTAYAKAYRHAIPKNTKFNEATGDYASKDTFDDEGLRTLVKRYGHKPEGRLYGLVEGFRTLQKAQGTYLNKLLPTSDLVGPDGRIHDAFRHTPKTLRLAMELLQVLPRPEVGEIGPSDPRRIYDSIRKCIVPAPGRLFVAADFSGIEPLLVAYCARDKHFLRAARISAHSWLASHVVGSPADFDSLSDPDIAAHYAALAEGGPYTLGQGKTEVTLPWKTVRMACKITVMTSLYAGGPTEIARQNPDIFATRTVADRYQRVLFEACPRLRAWHWEQAEQVERQGYLDTPIGFRLHGEEPFTYAKSPSTGKWERKLSKAAKELIAAGPQHMGAMYLVTALLALGREYPDLADAVRLLIHDEIFGEPLVAEADRFEAALVEVMERPHPLMPLEWAGEAGCLQVKVETKRSAVSWGDMR